VSRYALSKPGAFVVICKIIISELIFELFVSLYKLLSVSNAAKIALLYVSLSLGLNVPQN